MFIIVTSVYALNIKFPQKHYITTPLAGYGIFILENVLIERYRITTGWNFKLWNIRTFTEPSELLLMVTAWRFLICRQCIFTMLLLSCIRKGCDPSFEQTWIPLEISPVILEKKTKLWKVYDLIKGVTYSSTSMCAWVHDMCIISSGVYHDMIEVNLPWLF